MKSTVTLDVSVEIYEGLKEVADKDGITIGDVCNTVVDYYVLTYQRAINPPAEGNITKDAKKHPRLYALAYKEELLEKRIEESVRKGNITQLD